MADFYSYIPTTIPTCNWNTEHKQTELNTFNNACTYQLVQLYASLLEIKKNMFVLLWMGDEGQILYEDSFPKQDDKSPL